jgi:hypothetical protein
MAPRAIVNRAQKSLPGSSKFRLPKQKQLRRSPSSLVSQPSLQPLPVALYEYANNALLYFEKVIPDQTLANFTVQELMLHAISQTAIATFETNSQEIFAQDGYMMDEHGQVRSKTFVYSENIRHQIHHQATNFRTALGCLWIRRTTISHVNERTGELERSQTVTSIAFYPTKWLQLMGVRNGLEAVIASAGRSWLYNCRVTVTRAVREDSLIFELCSAGELRAVQMLLERDQGSVVDTSPKGWKPLHVRLQPFLTLRSNQIGLNTNNLPVCCSGRSCRIMRHVDSGGCRQNRARIRRTYRVCSVSNRSEDSDKS